ncbi:hypothetical protein NMG60_11036493, partial [Bertholletia excelsa]
MECEVRVTAAIESCFVSLPLLLIQTLQQTRSASDSLPPVLALELRPHSGNSEELWHVAWSGSVSSSSVIEVAQQYAECIGLPDHTTVQVRAVSNLPKATLVTIEPNTEDDWEVLELNSEYAEAAILEQVGIVHEAMRFPLWLHGRTVVIFLVVSTFPKNPAVQLVPGTEVAVAPKMRKRVGGSFGNSSAQSNKNFIGEALLRVQDPDERLIHKCEVNGVEMRVALTSVIFIHPETVKNYLLDIKLAVILPRLSSRETSRSHEIDRSVKSSSTKKQASGGILPEKQDCRQAVVYVLISQSVAKGHVMLSKTLCLYLGASVHSWIYVRPCHISLKKEVPSFSLSPCQFKLGGYSKAHESNGQGGAGSQRNIHANNMLHKTNPDVTMGVIDWPTHESLIAALSSGLPAMEDEGSITKFDNRLGMCSLLHAWYFAQVQAIALHGGGELNSLVLGNETLLHFVLKGYGNDQFGKVHSSFKSSSGVGSKTREPWTDILYVLSTSGETLQKGEKFFSYELAFGEADIGSSELLLGKLSLGDPIYFYSAKERTSEKLFGSKHSSLGWMGTVASDVFNRLIALLSPASGVLMSSYNLPFPGHILIHGPPGSGKTLLATCMAKSVEEHGEILAHIVFVSCTKLALEKSATIRQELSGYISEALDHAPSVVIFDDFDSIISSAVDMEGSQPSTSFVELTQFLLDVMDEYEEKRRSSCGFGPMAFIASVQSLSSMPQSLSSSGRFDFHVKLPAPAASERHALLKLEIQKRSLECADDTLMHISSKCDGYDAYDLEILVDRAVHAAVYRSKSYDLPFRQPEKPILLRDDFLQAMQGFLPVSMRDLAKSASLGSHTGWEDVGGLPEIKNSIKEMIELPSKFPNIFSHAPLRLRSNVLLYGPPGCGKTHIVGAAAAACSLRFVSVKGPELLNKYIGASEQAVRDIFSKAAAAAPCLLFFDEFDSIAPKRGHDNTGVTDRVVNQFLTELDGVEVLTGVFVFAAT